MAKILYAEDGEDLRSDMKFVLEQAGHEVDVVEDSRAAYKLLKANHYDLLLTDFDLGACPNGLDLINLARTIHPDIPAVLTSSSTLSMIMEERGLEEQPQATFVQKDVIGYAGKIKSAIVNALQATKPIIGAGAETSRQGL